MAARISWKVMASKCVTLAKLKAAKFAFCEEVEFATKVAHKFDSNDNLDGSSAFCKRTGRS